MKRVFHSRQICCDQFTHNLPLPKSSVLCPCVWKRVLPTSGGYTDKLNLFLIPTIVVSINYNISYLSTISESYTYRLNSAPGVFENQGFGSVWFIRCFPTVRIYNSVSKRWADTNQQLHAAPQTNWTYFWFPRLLSQSIITSLIYPQSQNHTLIDLIPRQGFLKTRDLDQRGLYGVLPPSGYTILYSNDWQTRINNFRRLHRQIEPISDSHDCCLNQL